jgi:hypothetical protein
MPPGRGTGRLQDISAITGAVVVPVIAAQEMPVPSQPAQARPGQARGAPTRRSPGKLTCWRCAASLGG